MNTRILVDEVQNKFLTCVFWQVFGIKLISKLWAVFKANFYTIMKTLVWHHLSDQFSYCLIYYDRWTTQITFYWKYWEIQIGNFQNDILWLVRLKNIKDSPYCTTHFNFITVRWEYIFQFYFDIIFHFSGFILIIYIVQKCFFLFWKTFFSIKIENQFGLRF